MSTPPAVRLWRWQIFWRYCSWRVYEIWMRTPDPFGFILDITAMPPRNRLIAPFRANLPVLHAIAASFCYCQS